MSERPSERRALVTGGTGTLGRQVVAAHGERTLGRVRFVDCTRRRR